MKKNIVYVFTGTGNSLKVAKDIAVAMSDCEIISMGSNIQYDLEGGYETIGFVFPTYYRGEPRKVREFIRHLNLQHNKNAYYFAVTTMGKYDGNTLCHIKKLLKRKGITLQYAKSLDMFSNYVISYDMRDTIAEETKQSEIDFKPILQDIKNRKINEVARIEPFQEIAYRSLIQFVPEMDKYYSVSDDCIKCGICEKVCPVGNIGIDEVGRPYFKHHCEQCVACIQFCPKKAINYKDKTQSRKRYIHPTIKYEDLAALNGKVKSMYMGNTTASFSSNKKKSFLEIISTPFAYIIWKIYKM
jgi:ferredoxin/flavodoxin